MATVVVAPSGGTNIVIRLLWFVLIGWWLGAIVSALSWLLIVSIIGMPLGLWMVNRLPGVLTLRPTNHKWVVEEGVLRQDGNQRSFILRAIYFVLVGWWLNGFWMLAAYIFMVTIIGLPVAFWMYGQVATVTTLQRN